MRFLIVLLIYNHLKKFKLEHIMKNINFILCLI